MGRSTIDIRRHCQPAKDPETGASLDELTEEGIAQSIEIGKMLVIPEGGVIGYHSPTHRAYQTLIGIMQGANQTSEVCVSEALNTMKMSDEFKRNALMNLDGSKRTYNEVVNYCIDNSANKEETFQEVGKRIMQYILESSVDMNNDSLVESISHGPCVEAGLISLMSTAGKKIKDIEEVGGGFQPGDGFQVVTEYNEKSGLYTATLECRDEKIKVEI